MANERRIGVIIPTVAGYIHSVVKGVGMAAGARRAWKVRVAGGFDNVISRLLDWKPEGVVANIFSSEVKMILHDLGIPVVNVSGGALDAGFPTVCLDDRRIGAMAAEYLWNLRLEHFAYWSGHNTDFAANRRDGFVDALRRRGVEAGCMHSLTWPHRADWRQRDQAIRDWMIGLPKPVGLLASHDAQAYYLSDLAQEAGLDVPNEIALLGVDDDSLLCELTHPPLSSIRLPGIQVGVRAAELLAHLLDGGTPPTEPILHAPIGVIERGSSDMLAIDDPDIIKAVRFIRRHATEGIAVGDVLTHISVSRRRLEQQFQNLFDRSPGAEIRRVQVDHARRLLEEGDAPISEVARRSGFCDAEYLARVFRKRFGIPPSRYRRANRPNL